MILPQTGLPWDVDLDTGRLVAASDAPMAGIVATFRTAEDAAYAVHASNVLAVVVEALRDGIRFAGEREADALAASQPKPYADWQDLRVRLHMALLKAEGGE